MKVGIVIIGALLLGSLLGAAWSTIEYRDPGDDIRAMVERLNSAQASTSDRTPGSPAAVVLDGKEFDFGVMDLTETRTHTFKIHNEGDAPLTLELLGTTCKCAIGTLTEGAIPPDGVGEVELEWTAKDEAPEYRQSATIETNDPLNKILYLSVAGKVTQVIRAVPRALIFTDIPASEGRTASFDLLNFKEEQFELDGFSWEDDELAANFRFSYEPMTTDQLAESYGALSGFRCHVAVPAGLPMGTFSNLLTLNLNLDSARKLAVPVRGNVVTDIRIVGHGFQDRVGRLELGMVPSAGATRELLILAKGSHRDGLEIAVDEISPAGILTAQVGEGTSLNKGAVWKFPLVITVLPSDEPISHLVSSKQEPARVVLKTNHPTVSQIDVDVSFAVGDN